MASDSSSPNTATTPDDRRMMSPAAQFFTLQSLWPRPTSRLETKWEPRIGDHDKAIANLGKRVTKLESEKRPPVS